MLTVNTSYLVDLPFFLNISFSPPLVLTHQIYYCKIILLDHGLCYQRDGDPDSTKGGEKSYLEHAVMYYACAAGIISND